jgi:hypothetical protein
MTNDNQDVARRRAARRKSNAFNYRSHRLWQTDYMRRPSDLAVALEARTREEYWLRQMGLTAPKVGS